jgi:hypothetical protein
MIMAATHERSIAAAPKEEFTDLHFTHLLGDNGLELDYELREKIVEEGSAIKLLRLLGYPPKMLEGL